MTLELRALSFAYRDRQALRDVSLTVRGGELLYLLGPNGAGKSTLFRCALSLVRGYTGEILLDGSGTRVMSPAVLARKIAYIPQSHQAVFDYSVLEIVLMGAVGERGLFTAPRAGDVSKSRARLESLGIGHLAERSYALISGGERQLALIARALVQEAGVLVMDEPTANLDYGNQVRVMEHVAGLSRDGYAVVLSTHNPEHAFLWATRVAILAAGEIVAEGRPTDVLTEEVMERIYGVKVSLFPIDVRNGGGYRACVPHSMSERKAE